MVEYGTASRQFDSSESRRSLRHGMAIQPTRRRRVVALDVATGCIGGGAESVAPSHRDRCIGDRVKPIDAADTGKRRVTNRFTLNFRLVCPKVEGVSGD